MVSDAVSTALGAPPNSWKSKEAEQMKHIQRCYRNAYTKDEREEVVKQVDLAEMSERDALGMLFGGGDRSAVNEVKEQAVYAPGEMAKTNTANTVGTTGTQQKDGEDIQNNTEESRDEEWFLPKNSPLRSKAGDLKAPLNVPFKDHEAFLTSCEFDQWREIFQTQAQDNFLSEVARSLISNICTSQSRKELRVRHGSMPAGRILRKKREHITPLALVLHELKLWAAHKLRSSSIFEEDTFKDIRRRIRYIEALSQKEVWGDAAGMLQAGMRPIAHDKLFRLFLTAKEDLQRAEEYAYRGYSRRSSREKLKRLSNLMKEVILGEIRIVSYLFTLKNKLSDPKTKRLQPLTLLNEVQNQGFVDYGNFVNICMYELMQIPLVGAAITSDYEKPEVRTALEDLSNWTASNLFCAPSENGGDPEFRLSEDGLLPEVYAVGAQNIKDLLKANDPHTKPPLTHKKHVKQLTKAFKKKETIEIIMKLFLKVAAAVQDLIPGLFATYKLWSIAGDGGDFTVYDTLRAQVVNVMSNTISRVYAVQTTSKNLVNKIAELAKESEDYMEKKRLRTRKAEYKPAWITNFYFLRTEILPAEQKSYAEAYKQLYEIARDAFEYTLSAEQLDEKVATVKELCDAITGQKGELPNNDALQTFDVIKVGKEADWLNSRGMGKSSVNNQKVTGKLDSENSTEEDEYSDDEDDSDEYSDY